MFGVGSKQFGCGRVWLRTVETVVALCVACLVGLWPGGPVLAAPTPESAPKNSEADARVVVTASRIPQYIYETPVVVDVITREELETLGGGDLERVLRHRAGISLLSYGGTGSMTSVFLRGAPRRHILVLVDGVPVDTLQVEAVIGEIPASVIERVEILRGPASSVWGTQAAGGVINIITRSSLDAPSWDVTVLGSQAAWDGRLVYSGSLGDDRGIIVSAESKYDDGFRGHDDYSSTRFTARYDQQLDPDRSLDVRLSHVTSQLGDPGSVLLPARSRQTDEESRLAVRLSSSRPLLGSRGSYELQLYGSRLSRRYRSPYSSSRHVNHTLGGEVSAQTLLPHGQLHIGVSLRNEHTESTDLVDGEYSRFFGALSTELLHRVSPRFMITAGVRTDFSAVHQAEFSPRLGLRYDHSLSDSYRFVVGRSFRYPSFSDLYWHRLGNPNLKPESGWSVEIGGDHQHSSGLQWSWTVFHRHMRDLIIYDALIDEMRNLDETRTEGVELSVTRGLTHNLDLVINGTLLKAVDLKTDEELNYVPSLEASLQLHYRGSNHQWTLSGRYMGERYGVRVFPDWSSERIKMPSHFVLDGQLVWNLNPYWQLRASVYNLLDTSYEEFPDYPMPGRTVWVGFSYQF